VYRKLGLRSRAELAYRYAPASAAKFRDSPVS
jgi:hypothetical protein